LESFAEDNKIEDLEKAIDLIDKPTHKILLKDEKLRTLLASLKTTLITNIPDLAEKYPVSKH
nr:hypothetical protein [Pseudomonadota bacterium]